VMMDEAGAAIGRCNRRDRCGTVTQRARAGAIVPRRIGAYGHGGRAPTPVAIDPAADIDGIVETERLESQGQSP